MYPFIENLLEMLEAPFYHKYISWSEDGKSICIHDDDRFETEVLKRRKQSGRFDSFCRQLNIYKFTRTSDARKQRSDTDRRSSSFQHPHFQRGRRDLLHNIVRDKKSRSDQLHLDHHPYKYARSSYLPSRRTSLFELQRPVIDLPRTLPPPFSTIDYSTRTSSPSFSRRSSAYMERSPFDEVMIRRLSHPTLNYSRVYTPSFTNNTTTCVSPNALPSSSFSLDESLTLPPIKEVFQEKLLQA